MTEFRTYPGQWYRFKDGRITQAFTEEDEALRHADAVHVCRRVADFPDATPPAAARRTTCELCREWIAYNPASPVLGYRVCLQCVGIEPLPFD